MGQTVFRFQAHKGVSSQFPENTMPAFQAAVGEGYHVIELDNKFTKDDVCICLHDSTLNRTCRFEDGTPLADPMPADSLTLDEIRRFDAGLYKGEAFAKTRIPTLEEVIDFVGTSSTTHIKLDNVFQSFSQKRFELLCAVVRTSGFEDRVGFTCKTLPYLAFLSERFPDSELHYDGSMTEDVLSYAKRHLKDRITLWVPYDNRSTSWCTEKKADRDYCAHLHEFGKVGIWILSEQEELMRAATEFGADIIETNGELKPRDYTNKQ